MTLTLVVVALTSLIVGTGGIWLALSPHVPIEWQYVHQRWRKPVLWILVATSMGLAAALAPWTSPAVVTVCLAVTALSVVLGYRMHQEVVFPAVDFPAAATDPSNLPIQPGASVAVVEVDGVVRAYPLDYVIHHHVVNDRFGDRTISLTYCAMCRSIIPFDVSDIGPLFVGSFYDANMVVADRATGTFFQQSTGRSLIGPLHPHELTMIPFQILSWEEVLELTPVPHVVSVTPHDLRPFQLPIPGIWGRILASEATPGLHSSHRDEKFPARTRVVGVTDSAVPRRSAYLKSDIEARQIYQDPEAGIVLICRGDVVNAFHDTVDGHPVTLAFDGTHLVDRDSQSRWDLLGRHRSGPINSSLDPVATSDEYWFSWSYFHPEVPVQRL